MMMNIVPWAVRVEKNERLQVPREPEPGWKTWSDCCIIRTSWTPSGWYFDCQHQRVVSCVLCSSISILRTHDSEVQRATFKFQGVSKNADFKFRHHDIPCRPPIVRPWPNLLLMGYRKPPKVEKFNTPTAHTTPHLAFPALFSIPSYP